MLAAAQASALWRPSKAEVPARLMPLHDCCCQLVLRIFIFRSRVITAYRSRTMACRRRRNAYFSPVSRRLAQQPNIPILSPLSSDTSMLRQNRFSFATAVSPYRHFVFAVIRTIFPDASAISQITGARLSSYRRLAQNALQMAENRRRGGTFDFAWRAYSEFHLQRDRYKYYRGERPVTRC